MLLDFGAARQALGEHSKNFTTLLTEGYAPFEQYAGSGNQGPWSDVYALAAVMFRCLMGKAPIEAPRRAVATLRGQTDPHAAELAALRNRVSPDIAIAIEAGLRVVEQERPSSVGAFRDLIVRPDMTSRTAMAAAAPSPFSTATLIPDGALRATSRYPRDTVPRERPRRRMATYVGVGAVLVAAAGAAAYIGDHRSWLPDFFRQAGTEPATATTIPAGPKTGRDPDSAPPPERAPEEKAAAPNDDSLKGFAEHQRRQLEQVEAERRQWEAQKSTEAERKRLEDETAKNEAERKQQQEERDRKAEEDKARAEEERRARVEQESRRQDQDRAREAEERVRRAPDPPARTGRDPQRQAIPGPPDMPDPRRSGQRPGPPNTAPGDGAIRTPPA
ncbi:MAG: hypothetical protein ACREIP_18070, partial [Alphaproteobacteria bacterium]